MHGAGGAALIMIFGHHTQYEHLKTALENDKLHHAYLFAGPRGIGKAGFAREMACEFLGQSSAGDTAQLLASGAHPDFMRLEIEADPKTGKMRNEITRTQVEQLLDFLTKHVVLAQRKVVLIDAIDDLNINAANNLLKWLEEPRAKTCLLLISHRPAHLLPTIRSRCATLRFNPLNKDDFYRAAQYLDISDPQSVFTLSGGIPGEALDLTRPEVQGVYLKIRQLIDDFKTVDPLQLANRGHEMLVSPDSDGLRLSLRLLRHSLWQQATQEGQGEEGLTQFSAAAYALTKGREEQVKALNMDVAHVWSRLLLDLHDLARQGQSHVNAA